MHGAKQYNASRLRYLDAGSDVRVEKQFFHGDFVRTELFNQHVQRVINHRESRGDTFVLRRLYHSVIDGNDFASVFFYYAVAYCAVPRVNA